jgi:HK97 gp10 family phage protein
MANRGKIVILGLDELRQQMRGLSNKLTDKPMRRAVAFGAGVVRDAARNLAPVRTGKMRASISTRRDTQDSIKGRREVRGIGIFRVKALYADNPKNRQKGRAGKPYLTDPPTFYWKFVEFGTVKMQARPFLRPAFEQTKQVAAETIRTRLKQELQQVLKKR